MEGSSQTIHTASEGQVGIRQSTAYQMACVGTHITTLVVTEKYTDLYLSHNVQYFTDWLTIGATSVSQ